VLWELSYGYSAVKTRMTTPEQLKNWVMVLMRQGWPLDGSEVKMCLGMKGVQDLFRDSLHDEIHYLRHRSWDKLCREIEKTD
jgi:hypothetical protein